MAGNKRLLELLFIKCKANTLYGFRSMEIQVNLTGTFFLG